MYSIWTGSYRQLELFNYFKKIYETIQFTIEKEVEGSLNCLDLILTKTSNGFDYNIYRKPTYTLTPAYNNLSEGVKLSSLDMYIQKLQNIPLQKENRYNLIY